MPRVRKATPIEIAGWESRPRPAILRKRRSPATAEEIAALRASLKGFIGISRIDQESRCTHGWFTRVYAGSTTIAARLFSDGKYDGAARALAAAQAWVRATRKQRADASV